MKINNTAVGRKKIPINNSNYIAYQRDESIILFHKKNCDLNVLSGISAWIFLMIDDDIPYNEVSKKAGDLDNFELIYSQMQKLHHSPSSKDNRYRQEFDNILDTEAKKFYSYDSSESIHLSIANRKVHIFSKNEELIIKCKQFFQVFTRTDTSTSRFNFEIIFSNNSIYIYIYCNTIFLAKMTDIKEFMPVFVDHIQNILYQSTNYLLSFHSASLAKENSALLIPGTSGSGKSTLCMGLINNGFRCFSDEISVISLSKQLLSIPLPASIKTGSWKLFENIYPELKTAEKWYRKDGRILKYLHIPKNKFPSVEQEKNITSYTIIFPHYNEHCKSITSKKLNGIHILAELTRSGYQIKHELSKEKLEKIFDWLDNIKAYTICYSSQEEAQQFVKKVMRKN